MKNKFLGWIVKFLIILGIIGIAIFAGKLSAKAKEDGGRHKEKIEKEIDYLDAHITSLANKLNGIILESYKVSISKIREENATEKSGANSSDKKSGEKSETKGEESETSGEQTKLTKMEQELVGKEEDGEIDWNWMEGKTETLYSAWSTIVLDLYDIDVESSKILEFSNLLDKTVIDIKNKDEKSVAQTYAGLYSLVVDFSKKTEMGKEKKAAIEIKGDIIKAYAHVSSEDWDSVQAEIASAEKKATNLVNEVNKEDKPKKYNINKMYILLEELKNSLDTKERRIFYIKYKNLIEEINTII